MDNSSVKCTKCGALSTPCSCVKFTEWPTLYPSVDPIPAFLADTRRKDFAKAAMQGILSAMSEDSVFNTPESHVTDLAVAYADALIKSLEATGD